MTDNLSKIKMDDAVKAFKDLADAHKAYKNAADGVHGLKDDASKDDVSKAFKDLAEAHKELKEAADAHKDACMKMRKSIGKEDEDADSEKFEKMMDAVITLAGEVAGLKKSLANTPAPSPLELAMKELELKKTTTTTQEIVIDPKAPIEDQRLALCKMAVTKGIPIEQAPQDIQAKVLSK